MAAIAFSADGTKIFLAVQDNTTGHQLVASANRVNLSAWSAAYQPNTGNACNVSPDPGNANVMYFYGAFGTGVAIIKHTISTGNNADISPAGLGASDYCNAMSVNPTTQRNGISEKLIAVDSGALKYSSDDGATWLDWTTSIALGGITTLFVFWKANLPHTYFVGGNNVTGKIFLSPNQGAKQNEITGSISTVNFASIEAVRI